MGLPQWGNGRAASGSSGGLPRARALGRPAIAESADAGKRALLGGKLPQGALRR